jgi:hypothetical protein
MARFNVTGMAENSFPPGSIQEKLNLDPNTGRTRFGVGSAQYAEIAHLLPEFDRSLPPEERDAARRSRLAREIAATKAAIDTALATGIVEAPYVVVEREDLSTGISIGVAFPNDSGFLMIREEELETVASMGYHASPFPKHRPIPAPIKLKVGTLPPAPLAVVRHNLSTAEWPSSVVSHDMGHGGCRLILVSDLKFVASLGWQPTAWPPAR